MAQVEFSQQFSYNYTGLGGSTGLQYFQLQATTGKYIVKGLTCYSTSGVNSGGSFSVQLGTSVSVSSPAYIFTMKDTVAANVMIPVYDPEHQIILDQGYLSFIADMAGAGNFIINISYIFIPSTNISSGNFLRTAATVNNTTGASLTGLSATTATIIKSIWITNAQGGGDTNVTLLLNGVAIDNVVAITAGASYCFVLPLYLNNTQTLSVSSITSSGSATCTVNYSYTQD